MAKEPTTQAVLQLLTQQDDYISGEQMSQTLELSRTAIWKGIESLRRAGYKIEARTRRGYRLSAMPDILQIDEIYAQMNRTDFCREIIYLDEIDSTNSYLKRRAAEGENLQHGTVVIANSQHGGRGRQGRGFASPKGQGLFLSVFLRAPGTSAASVTGLTAFAAVAVCQAIEAVAAVQPQIKWVNDVLVKDKKICGILTEMSIVGEMGLVDYIVIGAGINVRQQPADFPAEFRSRATSLLQHCKEPPSRNHLAAALIEAFADMYDVYLATPAAYAKYLQQYRERSATIGREILVIQADPENARRAQALDIDDDCALVVRYPDGKTESLRYGEASIRGTDGYI